MTEPLPAGNVAALRELLAGATPGPWRSEDDGMRGMDTHAYPEGPEPVWTGSGSYQVGDADAALIVALRNAAPLLLDVVDAARQATAVNGHIAVQGKVRLRKALAALDEFKP